MEEYRSWLVTERGLAANAVGYYVPAARLLLSEFGGRDLGELTLAEVSGFMVRHNRRLGVGVAKNLATGLRSFLGYLYLRGLTDRQLAQAVPAPPRPHGAGLPAG